MGVSLKSENQSCCIKVATLKERGSAESKSAHEKVKRFSFEMYPVVKN